jgi:hypothetical protein
MLKLPVAALAHRKFSDAMDQLSPEMLQDIHKVVVSTMVKRYGIETEGLMLDMTNVATYVDAANAQHDCQTWPLRTKAQRPAHRRALSHRDP